MVRIIAVANQKGGVAKTTTSVNLAASVAATRRRVLLVDLDPQGNATVGSGVDKTTLRYTLNDVLLGEVPAADAVATTPFHYDVLPSNGDLTVAEVRMLQMEGREQKLSDALQSLRQEYDYIFIDCPPSLNMLTVNGLVAASSVLIPIQCEYYALEGVTALVNTIEQIRSTANPALQIEGLLRTMYDGRNRLTLEVSAQLITHFGEKVYQAIIPRNVRVAEAPSHGQPVLYYDKNSQGAQAYLALAGEMVRRHAQEDEASQRTESTAEIS